jgi:presenilin-like A22 family membrane protease
MTSDVVIKVKHNITIILALVLIFFVAQSMGLWITHQYSDNPQLPLGIETPEIEESTSFIPIFILILIATGIGLLLARFNHSFIWKFWFLFTIWFTLVISLTILLGENLAILFATVLALLRVYKNNTVIHNFTEIFIYGALATLFTPIFNITSVFILLILISIYDYIAVRKTKHMIKLAKFEGNLKVFAGILIPYKKGVAILGGGDIGFPLLFAAVAMKEFVLPFLSIKTFIIPICVAISLALLFFYGDNKKYYPAMPYITLGCTAGYLILLLTNLF